MVAKRRRILLVGYGARGRQWLEACRRRRDVAVVGVVDPHPPARSDAEQAGLRSWESIGLALGSDVVDGTIIASPPADHVGQALECLAAGLPVLVEKPLALTVDDAAHLAAASRSLGVPVVVGQNFRFLRRERAVRQALAEVGPALGGTIVSARPSSVARPHLATIEHGAVWDICLHHLDALRSRFGATPETVATTVRHVGADDHPRYRVELEWREGPGIVYEHSEGAPGFFHAEWIEAGRHAIVVRDQDVSILFAGRRPRTVSVPRGPVPEQALLDALLSAIAIGQVSTLGVEDNLMTIATVEAVVSSAAHGQPVEPAALAERADVQHAPIRR
jgi:predicted dehydrogenase